MPTSYRRYGTRVTYRTIGGLHLRLDSDAERDVARWLDTAGYHFWRPNWQLASPLGGWMPDFGVEAGARHWLVEVIDRLDDLDPQLVARMVAANGARPTRLALFVRRPIRWIDVGQDGSLSFGSPPPPTGRAPD
jgi:hypothetical protein